MTIKNIEDDIKNLIEQYINPGLAAHGGSASFNEVRLLGDSWEVILDFNGGCNGCPSSFGDTLRSIEFFLREELNAPTLQVKNSKIL